MFDQKEMIRRICHAWIRQGQLTKKEWALLQARAVHNKQPLEELLLTSTQITEQMLLEALSTEMSCRLWQGEELLQHIMKQPLVTNPLSDTMLLEHKIALLRWSPEEGILHIVMPKIPSSLLLKEFKRITGLYKLQFELGTTESIDAVLSYRFTQPSHSTPQAPEIDATQAIQSLNQTTPQAFAKTGSNSPFDMDTIRVAPTKKPSSHEENQTFSVLSLTDTQEETADKNDAQARFTYTGDGETDYQPPPSIYPASGRTPSPNATPDTFENEPHPAQQFESKSFSDMQASPIKSTEMWGSVESQIEEHHKEEMALLDVSDDEFFLDYTNDRQNSNISERNEDSDDDWTEPAKPYKEPKIQPEDDWSVVLPTKKEEPVRQSEVLELIEEVASFELEPSPLTDRPEQPPTPKKSSILGDSIFPSDQQSFSAEEEKKEQASYRLPSRPQGQNRSINPAPLSPVKIGERARQHKASEQPKPPKKQLKKQAEKFALTVILGGLMTVINIVLRLGIVGLIGYMIWFLFFSKSN